MKFNFLELNFSFLLIFLEIDFLKFNFEDSNFSKAKIPGDLNLKSIYNVYEIQS